MSFGPPFLALRQFGLSFGGKPLFMNLDLQISRGDRLCLVGRNGTGKSTLLKIIAGQIDLDSGERFVQPGLKIAYLPQEVSFPDSGTVGDYIARHSGSESYEQDAMLDIFSISPDKNLRGLSGGERRRVALVAALAGENNLLLLDEPTNHLDIMAIEALEKKMLSFRGACLLISHDRAFLEKVSNKTVWLDRGMLRTHAKGYSDFDRWSEEVMAEEERNLEKLDVKLRQETHWLHRGVTARRRRNQGRLKQLYALRQERRERSLNTHKKMTLGSVDSDISSKMVIEAQEISKSVGEGDHQTLLIKNFNLRLLKGDRIGIVGPNGVGKTTLLKMLVGECPPDSGEVRQGKTLTLTYFDQLRDGLKPQDTLWESLCDTGGDHITVGGKSRHIMAYLKDFLFDEKQVRGPVSILSGGEKNRLALAKCLARSSTLLILDEPTNDLDMETLDLLIDLLSEYEGTLLIVSHDRDFLDKLTTSLLVFEGSGVIEEFIGGYTEYLQKCTYPPFSKYLKAHIALPLADGKKEAFRESEATPSPKKLKKLSYHEQREYDQLMDTLEQCQREIQTLEKTLGDPSFFQKNPQEFQNQSRRLEQCQREKDRLENRWMELTEKIEGF